MGAPDDVLTFWFETLTPEQRFKRNDAIDGEIEARFGTLHAELTQSIPPEWRADGRTTLAAIIVLDQFSRNIFRDDARAYAQDSFALSLARQAIEQGRDMALSADEKQFLYMPFMHSERLADVERCITLMHEAGHDQGEDFARRHAAVISRFGRYPARNAALGRDTTKEEAAFLEKTPTGF